MISKVSMINKNNPVLKIGLFIIIVFIYFFSRTQNLTSIPVFGDEAIYIRWSQIIRNEETLRFIPVTDGKQPLYMWILAGLIKIFSDPLVAGRLISVFSGFGTLIVIFLSICLISSYNKKEDNILKFISTSIKDNFYVGLTGSFIYITLPFSFFFDRMALPDNLLSFFGILSLYLSLLNAKFKRLDLSMILGATLGLAWLTKSPAIYFIALSAFTFIVLNFKNIKSLFFPILSTIISFAIYNILRLGPQFNMISVRNRDYVWSISEILKHPLDPLKPHLIDVFNIYINYISIPIIISFLLGIYLLIKNKSKKQLLNLSVLLVSLWWISPLLANSAIAKVFTARYILYTLPPFIVLITIGVFYLFSLIKIRFNPFILSLLLISFLFFNVRFIYKLSINPFNIRLPSTEVGYISDWTSGWGIKNTSEYLKNRSLEKNVIVGTEGFFGTLPDGLQIYTQNTKQLTVFGVGIGFAEIPEKLLIAKDYGDEVYLLINQSRSKLTPAALQKLTIIKQYDKPNNDKLVLYKL